MPRLFFTMTDPLSALLGSKKKEEKAKPAPKPKPSSSLFDSSALGGIGGIGADLTDVSAALGGGRRNVEPSQETFKPSLNRANTVPVGSSPSSAFDFPTAADPSPPPSLNHAPTRGHGSVVNGLAAAASQLSSGDAPMPSGVGQGSFDDMLEGEKTCFIVKKCFLKVSNPLCEVPGRVLCTNYRLKFQSVKGGLRDELRWMQECKYFDVPMGALEALKVDSKQTVTGANEVTLKVTTKDGRLFLFLMTSEEECREVLLAVSSFSHPGNPTLLFAFKYCEEYRKRRPEIRQQDGWDLYDPLQDYARMGVDTDFSSNPACPWKASKLNTEYGLCSTYPSSLVLPRRMADHEIRNVAHFRKRGRLPSLSWCGGPELNYASVWRCAQTTEGIMGAKSPDDQKHVSCIRDGPRNSTDRDLLVIDLRPWKAAWANKAGGGGFEDYDRCNLIFGGIDNIHCVRDAWQKMGSAVQSVVEGEVGSWMKDVASSNWYDYIGAIMNCARKVIVELLHMKSNVMVHCSDGWDRTAQTTSLAMLCIDPHYRTQKGFLTLIQKEWCSFGHKFRTRLALGEAPTSEAAPIFVQWLESVYQVVIQSPNIFEFTPEILLRLSTEASSNRYGTFLTDCERERLQTVAPHTLSLWSILLLPSEAATWKNPSYRRSESPLIPVVSQACFSLWEGYWFRYHPRGQKLRTADSPSLAREASAGFLPEAAAAAEPLAASAAGTRAPNVLNPLNPLAPAPALPPLDAPPPKAPASTASALFSAEEIVAAPKAKPKQFFADDDDDEDVFSKSKK